jgi:hypothetical protein
VVAGEPTAPVAVAVDDVAQRPDDPESDGSAQAPAGRTRLVHASILHQDRGRPSAVPSSVPSMRGDRVEIVIDAGNEVRTYDILATRNGRRVEVETGRGLVTVTEVTRSGNPVRMARFMASRVLALVEHPAGSDPPAP